MTFENSNPENTLYIPERQKLYELYDLNYPIYESELRRQSRKIKNFLIDNNINASIKYRVKSFESYFSKLLRLFNESENKNIILTDLMGMRVICPFLEERDSALKLLPQIFNITEIEAKGAKHTFNEFGYDSTHVLADLPDSSPAMKIPYTVPVFEIQFRTILQEAWAEVEHELIYKANFSLLNTPIRRKLASLNASLALSDIIFQEIRDYQKEIQFLGDKRRERLQDKIQELENITIIDKISPQKEEVEEVQSAMSTFKPHQELDKKIFEALDAHSSQHYDKAIEIYTEILDMKPEDLVCSIIYNHRGMAYFVKSEYNKCIGDFTCAIEFNNNNFRAFTNRGLAFKMVHEYEKALNDMEASLHINKMHVDSYYSIALLYYDMQNYTGATEYCESALNIKPDFEPAKQLKALIGTKIFK